MKNIINFCSIFLEVWKKYDIFGDIMIQAILMERIGFIELLLMNGFVMKNFLTVEKLAHLYNEEVQLLHKVFLRMYLVKTKIRYLIS